MLNPIEKFKVAILHMKMHQIDCIQTIAFPSTSITYLGDAFIRAAHTRCGKFMPTK